VKSGAKQSGNDRKDSEPKMEKLYGDLLAKKLGPERKTVSRSSNATKT
jgi:hypothetical protein